MSTCWYQPWWFRYSLKNLVKDTWPLLRELRERTREKQIKEFLLHKLHDEGTADVSFQLRLTANTPSEFVYVYAHRCVLETYAPELARICLSASDNNDENTSTVNITDVKPDIFRRMIYYVYGVSVPQTELRKHAKDFIDVANKYSIVTLKMQAEASYMESTEITKDNVIDNLLYADEMGCALLKEAVMNFFPRAEDVESLDLLTGSQRKEVIAAFRGVSPGIFEDYCQEKTLEDIFSAPYLKNDPAETLLRKLLRDKETVDVCFKFNSEYVSDFDDDSSNCDSLSYYNIKGEGTCWISEFDYVYAHRCVLETYAPELARISLSASDDNDENTSTVNITDVKPDIFRHMIYYVYGVSVPQTELRKHAKDFIDVANKYSIVTLKEAAIKVKELEMKEANEILIEKKTNEGEKATGKAAKRKSEEQDSNTKEAEAEAETKTKKPKKIKMDSKKTVKRKDDDAPNDASVADKNCSSKSKLIGEVTTATDTKSTTTTSEGAEAKEAKECDPPTNVALVEEALKVSNIPRCFIALVLANYTKICVKSNSMKAELKNDNEEEDSEDGDDVLVDSDDDDDDNNDDGNESENQNGLSCGGALLEAEPLPERVAGINNHPKYEGKNYREEEDSEDEDDVLVDSDDDAGGGQ